MTHETAAQIDAKPILAAEFWPTNADLIADVARLGYLKVDDRVLDPTYGRGKWWTLWRPDSLVSCTNRSPLDRLPTDPDDMVYLTDFRHLPFVDETFDAVAFDPPYVCAGGRATSTLPDFQDRYGLNDAPRTPAELQELINAGLAECARVVKRRGIVLVKCQDYVTSGRLWEGATFTRNYAVDVLGLDVVDRFEHLSKAARAQPGGRRQVHARRNLSTLFVFRRPRPRRSIVNGG